jgi:hypothetical protein
MTMKINIKSLKNQLNHSQIHGNNIIAKLRNFSNLSASHQIKLQKTIENYDYWRINNETVKGYSDNIIERRVNWFNKYKYLIENEDFSAQSKFHSSALEEFLYYLFKDLVDEVNKKTKIKGKEILLGGIRAYSNLYFSPKNLNDFLKSPSVKINEKDQDFSIYRTILIKADKEAKIIHVPVISAECKTYIDKTMLEGSIATAEKIKNGNPHSLFLVITEWYDVSFEVDPAYSRIDQIYVLRKQKRKSIKSNPIDPQVVKGLFRDVKHHLSRNWSSIKEKLTAEGKIL